MRVWFWKVVVDESPAPHPVNLLPCDNLLLTRLNYQVCPLAAISSGIKIKAKVDQWLGISWGYLGREAERDERGEAAARRHSGRTE